MPETKTSTKYEKARTTDKVWTDEERAAMQASARERKARRSEARRTSGPTAKPRSRRRSPTCRPDRAMAERVHALVTSTAPGLVPKTYYGMPAYARDGKVICFFQPKSKFKVRYATFEFQPDATLDDGDMWPVSFAVTS